MLGDVTQTTEPQHSSRTFRRPPRIRIHRAWFVAVVTFVTIIGAAAFASLPGLLIEPLHEEFA